jgi:hypothetical protein
MSAIKWIYNKSTHSKEVDEQKRQAMSNVEDILALGFPKT